MIKIRKFFNVLTVITLLMGLFVIPTQAAPEPNTVEDIAADLLQQTGDDPQPTAPRKTRFDTAQLEAVDPNSITVVRPTSTKGQVVGEVKNATGLARYIVLLQEPALAEYKGGIPGLAPTSVEAIGGNKLNVNSAASLAYVRYLEGKQAQFVSALETTLDRTLVVSYRFQHAVNGLVLTLTPAEAAKIAQLPEVYLVERERDLPLDTDVGPVWIGAGGIWDGSTTGTATKGEGIVVGIIDTGINVISPTTYLGKTYQGHPSFIDPGPVDGYDHPAPAKFFGVCNSSSPDYDPTFPCNDKLIGAYDMQNSTADPDAPRDDNGHGSHTASTVAGNTITATVAAPTTSTQRIISGVAPHAQIIAYDACYTTSDGRGSCPNTATTAAADQAIADGVVDVINFSIGGGEAPWSDTTSLAFKSCRAAGIYVAASAGNEGPAANTVGHNEPWVSNTGASTHNRTYINSLIDMAGDGTPPADMTGKGFTAGYGPARIVYAGNYTSTIPNDALCLNPFPAGTWTNGEIVVCDRGTAGRVAKGQNVLAGGAGGYVLANDSANGNALTGDSHFLPAVHITYNDGVILKAWLASGTVHTATIGGFELVQDPALADIMADFSSRGWSTVPGLIKPDIIAPGVDVLAAVQSQAGFDFYGGTSMASPHHAGAAALLMALHPTWSPAEVQSALMTTAYREEIYKEDGTTEADPHDRGSGRVDLSKAALAGLVLDETITNYTNADPANGGDPKTLNLASMANDRCLGTCTWTRTVSSTVNASVIWTATFTGTAGLTINASPVTFTLPAYGEQTIVITADVGSLPASAWVFGEVILTADDPTIPEAHLTLGVKPTTGILPDYVRFDTRRNAGSELVTGIQTFEVVTLTTESFGLVKATLNDISLNQDPSNGDAYDNLTQVYYRTVTVPAGARRLVAEITASEAPDVDLFVGTGSTPSLATEVCASTTPSWNEYCDITDPITGTWWILVQNWAGSTSQPDAITLASAVVPGSDAGNMTFTGPVSVTAGTAFDLQLFWDTPTMMAGDRWYGAFSLGSEPGLEGNIGVVPVDIIRVDDDVVKTVSPQAAFYGDVVTYTVVIRPNVTAANLTYWLTDTIPTGLTYVPGSATASAGTVNVTGNQLTWTGLLYSPAGVPGGYNVTTNATDPLCDTGFGGYINLSDFGIYPQAALQGDVGAWTGFDTQAPIPFYNVNQTGFGFTTDGFAFFDVASLALPANTHIPNPANPNEIAPILWSDLNVVYQANVRGISMATAGPYVSLVEYDDVEIAGSSGTIVGDFEIGVFGGPISNVPGDYEIVYAYDNIQNLPASVTVGVENLDASLGSEFLYGNPTGIITNGLIVCFDYFQATYNPITITYQVQVDNTVPASPLTNDACSLTDNEGSQVECTSADVWVLGDAAKDISATQIDPGELVTYTIVLTAGPGLHTWTLDDAILPGLSFVAVDGATYVTASNSIHWSGLLGIGVATITEGFESTTFPPAGWAAYNVDGGGTQWVRSTSNSHTGVANAYHQFSIAGNQEGWLITPRFTVPVSGTFSFWQRDTYSFGSYYDHHGVWVTTDADPNPATAVYTNVWNGDVETAWTLQAVDLSAYAGQEVYVGFKYTGNDADDWRIDDVTYQAVASYPSQHVITLTLQGEVPGYYVNVAELDIDGQAMSAAAPELFVYGAIPTWNKTVKINSTAYNWSDGPFEVVDGDTVTIIDRVRVVFGAPITYTLQEEWTDSLSLVSSDVTFGTTTPGGNTLTWDVINGVSGSWYVLTKTFQVNDYHGFSDLITETLTVENGGLPQERVLVFNIPMAAEIEVHPTALSATQATDSQTDHTLHITNTGNINLNWHVPGTIVLAAQAIEALPMPTGQVVAESVTDATPDQVAPQAAAPEAIYAPSASVLYDNGPLVTHPNIGGVDFSRVQNTSLGMITYGINNNQATGFTAADDFGVDGIWQVDSLTFFAYQTGSSTASTITGLYYRIWNGRPDLPGSQVIWGNLTTNRLINTTWSGIYRDADNAVGNMQRPIMANIASAGFTLYPGTYWVEWATTGSLSSGPWAPPITILGQTITGNALQWNGAAWTAFTDGSTLTPQGLPFVIEGTQEVCGADWLSTTPVSGTLARDTSDQFTVTLDSTGYALGTYTATLCVVYNDSAHPVVQVPVTMTVLPQLTLVYHDLEDVVHAGEAVHVAGSFNSWNANALMMTPNGDHSVFTATVLVTGAVEYKYVVYTDTMHSGPANWNWLNSSNHSLNVTANTTVDDYRKVAPGYYVLQWPTSTTAVVGSPTENIYGQIWADDLTSRAGAPRAIAAELGYGTAADPATWTTWTAMSWGSQQGNNDEYVGTITPSAVGVYSYAVRYNANWGTGNPNDTWYYADTSWANNAYEPAYAGVLTVVPSCTLVSDIELSITTAGSIYPYSEVAFSVAITPTNLTIPYNYVVSYGDGTVITSTASINPLALTHTYTATGSYTVTVSVWNCNMTVPLTEQVVVTVMPFKVYLPIISNNMP